MKLDFSFVPFPREIWTNQVALSQAEFRLLGWFLCNLKFGVAATEANDDEILNGFKPDSRVVYPSVGLSRNSMKQARSALIEKGLLVATPIVRSKNRGRGNFADFSYRLSISTSDTEYDLRCQLMTPKVSNSDTLIGPQVSNSDTLSIIRREEQRNTEKAQAPLPGWLPKEPWEAFLEMRKAIKKPPTPYATKLLIGKLDKQRQSGGNVTAIIEQSIRNSWQDLFPVKEQSRSLFDNSEPQPRRIKNTVGVPHD